MLRTVGPLRELAAAGARRRPRASDRSFHASWRALVDELALLGQLVIHSPYAFVASAITHPFVYVGFTLFMTPGTIRYALVAESFAVGVEAWWLHRCANGRLTMIDALLWSLVANASSVAVGSSLDALWPGWDAQVNRGSRGSPHTHT